MKSMLRRRNSVFASLLVLGQLGIYVGANFASASDYLLGTGDLVRISVYGGPNLTFETSDRITSRGTVSFPEIGDIKVSGLTEYEAEQALGRALQEKEVYTTPYVNVTIEQFQSRQVSVLGNINGPGKYPLIPGTSLVDMLALAGGIKESGNSRVYVSRTTSDGKTKNLSIDIAMALQAKGDHNDIELQPNDIVFVPDLDTFYVYGEVNRPGEYPLKHDLTVMQAISVSGGLTELGTDKKLKIKRRGENREIKTLDAELTDVLMANDVVFVRESIF